MKHAPVQRYCVTYAYPMLLDRFAEVGSSVGSACETINPPFADLLHSLDSPQHAGISSLSLIYVKTYSIDR